MVVAIAALRAELFACIVDARRDKAAELFDAAAAFMGYRRVIQENLAPVLAEVENPGPAAPWR